MKNTWMRILALALAALMLISVVACKKEEQERSESATTAGANGEVATEKYQKDKVGNMDFDQQLVTVLYDESRTSEFDPESTGSIVEQAIVNRNITTKERLNIDLQFLPTPGGYNSVGNSPFKSTLQADITAGLGSYDICADYGMTIGACAVDGLCLDLMEYDVIDVTAPWWAPGLVKEATINGKLLFATGDISTSYLSSMYCMFFNKELMEAKGLEVPYEMIEMDNWKWEFFADMCKNLYAEADEIAVPSSGDEYAFVINPVVAESLFYSAGNKFVEQTENGEVVLSDSLSNARASNFFDFTANFLASKDCYVSNGSDDKGVVLAKANFLARKSVFTVNQISMAAELAAIEGLTFGVLPMPKYDDNQEFKSACWVGRSMYFLSSGSTIPEIAATTFEVLASEGYRQVTEKLYEDTYKIRYASDETVGLMVDIIRESISFDLAQTFVYSFENQLPTRMTRGLVIGNAAYYGEYINLSSAMAKYGTSMKQSVADIAKAYE